MRDKEGKNTRLMNIYAKYDAFNLIEHLLHNL